MFSARCRLIACTEKADAQHPTIALGSSSGARSRYEVKAPDHRPDASRLVEERATSRGPRRDPGRDQIVGDGQRLGHHLQACPSRAPPGQRSGADLHVVGGGRTVHDESGKDRDSCPACPGQPGRLGADQPVIETAIVVEPDEQRPLRAQRGSGQSIGISHDPGVSR